MTTDFVHNPLFFRYQKDITPQNPGLLFSPWKLWGSGVLKVT